MNSISNNLQHNYYILAPLNSDANEKMYQYDIYEDGQIASCFSSMVLCDKDLTILEHRLFDLLNAKFDIMINAYEEEILEAKHLSEAINIVESVLEQDINSDFNNLASSFKTLLNTALQANTDVGFYF